MFNLTINEISPCFVEDASDAACQMNDNALYVFIQYLLCNSRTSVHVATGPSNKIYQVAAPYLSIYLYRFFRAIWIKDLSTKGPKKDLPVPCIANMEAETARLRTKPLPIYSSHSQPDDAADVVRFYARYRHGTVRTAPTSPKNEESSDNLHKLHAEDAATKDGGSSAVIYAKPITPNVIFMPILCDMTAVAAFLSGKYGKESEYTESDSHIKHWILAKIDIGKCIIDIMDPMNTPSLRDIWTEILRVWVTSDTFSKCIGVKKRILDRDLQVRTFGSGVRHQKSSLLCGYFVSLYVDLCVQGLSIDQIATDPRCSELYIRQTYRRMVGMCLSMNATIADINKR